MSFVPENEMLEFARLWYGGFDSQLCKTAECGSFPPADDIQSWSAVQAEVESILKNPPLSIQPEDRFCADAIIIRARRITGVFDSEQ